MLNGRLVNLQKRLGFKVKHPHRIRIAVKKETILFFTVAQFLLRAPAIRHVAAIGHHAANIRVLQPVLSDQFQVPPFTDFVLMAKLYLHRAIRMIQRELKRLPHPRQIIGMHA